MSSGPPFPQIAIKSGDAISLVANTKGEYSKLNTFQQAVLLVRPEYAKKNPETVRHGGGLGSRQQVGGGEQCQRGGQSRG
jgi:hypothetical protein